MRHFSYTKLHRLTNNPTRFGIRQRHPQGVLSKLLDFPTGFPDTSNGYKHLSNHILWNCNLHTDAQFLKLHKGRFDS